MELYNAFLSRYGRLTEIQEKAMPVVESGSNCIITAPTGSGKTEAAMLPILGALPHNGHGIYVLYISPLRALNRDLMPRLKWLAELSSFTIGVRHGDTAQSERSRQSKNPPNILITTPETLQNLFLSPRLREALKSLRFVVVDELHELYPNKRGAQLSVALERLEQLSHGFVRIGLSATIADASDAAAFLFGKRHGSIITAAKPKSLSIGIEMPSEPSKGNAWLIDAFNLDKASAARLEFLSNAIKGSSATLIFGNTRQVVESVGSKLIHIAERQCGPKVGIHHSSLDKLERLDIEERFKRGTARCIMATSSLELGIDIGSVDLVVQYGSPRQASRLVQRVGRSGHAEGTASKGIILTSSVIEALESAAIAEDALSSRLEGPKAELNAADVLLNQICATALEYGSIGRDKLLGIIRCSSAFATLDTALFEKALVFAAEQSLIRIDGEMVVATGRGRKYFIRNVSVIPDSPRYTVRDVIRNKTISTLDEKFVYSYIEEGSSFITKGVPWRVISIEGNTINAEPAYDMGAAVPDWDGEDIPVGRKTAERVFSMLRSGASPLLPKDIADRAVSFMLEQQRFFVPGSGITVEEGEDLTLIYLPYGRQANELLARIICSTASQLAGSPVRARATPYAVVVDCTYLRKRPDMKRVLGLISKRHFSSAIDDIVCKTELFRYKFVNVAKLSGVIAKDAAITKSTADKLLNFYKGSIIYDETFRDLYKNNLDMRTVSELIQGLDSGGIGVEVLGGTTSPLYAELVNSSLHNREFMSMALKESEIEAFAKRFEGRNASLICTYCGTHFRHEIDARRKSTIACPICKSGMIALYSDAYMAAIAKKAKPKALNASERASYAAMMKEAGLISAYGSRAVVALMTYGIGHVTAARSLMMVRSDYKMFIADLIRAERLFVRNSRFWKGHAAKKREV